MSDIVPIPRVPITTRLATLDDLSFIDALQKMHWKQVGWMPTSALEGKDQGGAGADLGSGAERKPLRNNAPKAGTAASASAAIRHSAGNLGTSVRADHADREPA